MEEGFGKADLYVINQIMSDHVLEHQFGLPFGKEGFKKAIHSLAEAFSGHKRITVEVMEIAKIEEGKITELWGVPDRFAVRVQLGFLEPSKK